MLSRAERDFVRAPYQFSKNNSNVLRHRIRKKLKKAKRDFELLVKNCDDAGIPRPEILEVIGLSAHATDQKEILRLQKNEIKRYDSLSDYENW